jgi:hypothetical protein
MHFQEHASLIYDVMDDIIIFKLYFLYLYIVLDIIIQLSYTSDIEQLLQDIPVQPPLVFPVKMTQDVVAAGDLPWLPVDVDAANVS